MYNRIDGVQLLPTVVTPNFYMVQEIFFRYLLHCMYLPAFSLFCGNLYLFIFNICYVCKQVRFIFCTHFTKQQTTTNTMLTKVFSLFCLMAISARMMLCRHRQHSLKSVLYIMDAVYVQI